MTKIGRAEVLWHVLAVLYVLYTAINALILDYRCTDYFACIFAEPACEVYTYQTHYIYFQHVNVQYPHTVCKSSNRASSFRWQRLPHRLWALAYFHLGVGRTFGVAASDA